MNHAALIGVGLFMLTSLAVGVRLIMLYLKRRKLPELLMAIALLCTGFLAFAVGTAGKLLIEGSEQLRANLTWAGLVIEYVGDGALAVFAWRVFHEDERWARGVIAALALFALVALMGETLSGEYLRYSDSVAITGPWVPLGLLARGLAPGWVALECVRLWSKLRRRARLGLAEPLVVQRVGLWGIAMSASTGAYVVPIVHRLTYGTGLRSHLWAVSTVSALALVAAVSLGVAFFPPRRYRARMNSLQADVGPDDK